jgi:hypothetical protein
MRGLPYEEETNISASVNDGFRLEYLLWVTDLPVIEDFFFYWLTERVEAIVVVWE